MRSLNKKVKTLFIMLSFAVCMPISIAPTFAVPGVNETPVIDSSINGGNIGVNGTAADGKTQFDINMGANLYKKPGVALFDWKTFNVGSNVLVNWIFNGNGQKAINRVMNSGKASEIYGALTSSCSVSGCNYNKTGSVILINPNGITFGPGSSVNLNSFTASTRDIKGLNEFKDQLMRDANTITTDKTSGGVSYKNYADVVSLADGTLTGISGKYGSMTPITFDKSSVDSNGNGVISLDGTKFNKNGTTSMSVALIGDKININNSTIQTFESNGNDGNFGTGSTRSSVKLITADNVDLQYSSWGNVADSDKSGNSLVKIDGGFDANGNPLKPSVIASGKTSADYGINITNSKIYTGAIQAENRYEGANVNLNNATLYTTKMHKGTSGEIGVTSYGDVNLVNSRLETMPGFSDSANPTQSSHFGDIDINAKNNITIDNTRIASAPSDLNNGLAYGENAKAGNITIRADKGNITVQKSAEAVAAGNKQVGSLPIDIASYGNLRLESDFGTVKTDLTGTNTQLIAVQNLSIGAKNIELNGGNYISQRGNTQLRAGTLLKNESTGLMDILGGGIKINDAVLFADKANLIIEGLETTIANSTLDYGTLELYNDYYTANKLNHDVLIKDGTTFYDRQVENGTKDTLVIETTGQLIFDHNNLEKASFDNGEGLTPTVTKLGNQTANVKLSSTQSQVSIRNNSNITVDKNIELNGKTNANVSTSDITSNNGDINLIGGTKVTLGTAIDQIENDTNVITKKGSTLTARNGNINLRAKGDTVDPLAPTDIRGISILHSKLNSKNNTLVADNGDISVQSGTITATNNNSLTASNGRVGIQKHDCASYDCPDAIKNETSVLTAGNQSDIVAKNDVIITNSKVNAKNNNNITSQTNKVTVKGTGALVESTAADVTINQALTANLDNDFNQTPSVKAANNIYLNVKGNGQNINGSSLNQFVAGNRLSLDAENNINLNKETGNWNLSKVTLNSKENKITAKTGDVTITNDITLGDKANRTTITAGKNVKTNTDSQINANGKKLIVNAKENIDIAFTGVNNKAAGLEINTDVNTSNNQIAASEGNGALDGRNVKLTAKDKTISIAKVKADTLEIVDANNTKLIAATDNRPNAATDNIGPNNGTANVGTAYIEVKKLAGWNMDTDVDNLENIPDFYKANYDEAADGRTQRHFIQFNNEGNNENFLLVYQRKTEACDPAPIEPDDGGSMVVPNGTDLRESSVVRLPRHEEGVSAVAPVLNEITDPTANVIMAAARITLDDENEDDEETADAF